MHEEYPPELRRIVARFAPGWPPLVDVSAGWHHLLVELDRTLATIAPGYLIHQVKQKFGSLSFYAAPSEDPYDYNEEFQAAIRAAEWRSIETCEECGAPAKQYVIRMWVIALCDRHHDEVVDFDPAPS